MSPAASTQLLTTESQEPGASLVGRLAARALVLCLDAANALDDIADHLVRLASGDTISLRRAVRLVELRQRHPSSAPAELAIHALRMATARSVAAPSPAPESSRALT